MVLPPPDPLRLSLSELFRTDVLERSNLRKLWYEYQEDLKWHHWACDLKEDPGPISVRIEEWGSPTAPAPTLVGSFSSRHPFHGLDRSDEAPKPGQFVCAVEELIKGHITALRSGDLVADGVREDQSDVDARKDIPQDWWSKPNVWISYHDNTLIVREEYVDEERFVDVHITRRLEKHVPAGCTLIKAVDAIADPEDRESLQTARTGSVYSFWGPTMPVEDLGRPDEASERFSYFLKLDQRLRETIRKLLELGRLELQCWTDLGEDSIVIRPDRIPLLEFDFEASTVSFPKGSSATVRVYARSQSSTKAGRPSRKTEIIAAYQDLHDNNLIDYDGPLKALIEDVRKRVLEIASHESDWGLGEEAIRKQIAPFFRGEKERRARNQKPETINPEAN